MISFSIIYKTLCAFVGVLFLFGLLKLAGVFALMAMFFLLASYAPMVDFEYNPNMLKRNETDERLLAPRFIIYFIVTMWFAPFIIFRPIFMDFIAPNAPLLIGAIVLSAALALIELLNKDLLVEWFNGDR